MFVNFGANFFTKSQFSRSVTHGRAVHDVIHIFALIIKATYYNGQKISKEDDLQRLFRFVWYDSKFDVNYENNNGRGELDVKVSYGSKEKNIVEFKLASNPNLSHLFDQVKIYEQANQCSNSLYAIFYFSQGELEIVEKMLSKTNTKNLLGESVFLIDCRNDNKPSASTV